MFKRKFNSLGLLDIKVVFFLTVAFSIAYGLLAWLVSGHESWWLLDNVDGQNVFYGDDAYRFFLVRSVWLNPELYTYNFVLPGQLWLDGVITWFLGGDIFYSRVFHGVIGALCISLVYLIARSLRLSAYLSIIAALILGLTPRYAFMSLSFYGELWLGFFLALSVYFFINKKLAALAIVAAWLPLLRPEGIFFLIPIAFYFLRHGQYKALFFLLLPGSLFFIYLNISLANFSDYNFWRLELRRILSKIENPFDKNAYLYLYTFWLIVPAFLAIAFRPVRKELSIFLWGSLIWLLWLQSNIFLGLATLENRYTFILLPIAVILWACFFHFLRDFLAEKTVFKIFNNAFYAAVGFAALVVVGKGVLKIDNLRAAIDKYGYVEVAERVLKNQWDGLFFYYPSKAIEGRKKLVNEIYEVTRKDSGINLVGIYTPELYYFLDPYKLPKNVRVGFLTNGYGVFHLLLDGQSFIQHSGDKMYTYLTYGMPQWSKAEKRALIATVMPIENYPYMWQEGAAEMYLFSYLPSKKSRTVIEEKPDVTLEAYRELDQQWYQR